MLTDVQTRKLQKMFRYLDGNKDDILERADYDRMCERLLRVLEPPSNSKEAAEISDSYAFEWGELQELADQKGQQVTLALWLSYRDQKLSPDDAFETEIDPYIETVFVLLDRDHDGRLSSDDVRRYLGVYRMPDEELRVVLEKIDPENRGWFTRQEIGQLAKEYYFSNEESARGSWLLGRF